MCFMSITEIFCPVCEEVYHEMELPETCRFLPRGLTWDQCSLNPEILRFSNPGLECKTCRLKREEEERKRKREQEA